MEANLSLQEKANVAAALLIHYVNNYEPAIADRDAALKEVKRLRAVIRRLRAVIRALPPSKDGRIP